jgi:hypothetical protein
VAQARAAQALGGSEEIRDKSADLHHAELDGSFSNAIFVAIRNCPRWCAAGDEEMELQNISPEPKRRPSSRPRVTPIAVPVDEACQLGGFGKTKAWELIAANTLQTVKIGRRRLVLYASIEKLLQPQA